MRMIVLVALLLVASCGRPLTEGELAFAKAMHGDTLATDRVRFVEGALVGSVTFQRQARPRLTCQERLYPEPRTEIVTASPAAVALFNRVFFTRDYYAADYLPRYPEEMDLAAAMLFAHEVTHIWQWQNRARTGYTPLRAAREHVRSDDPYLFDPDHVGNFLYYGFEQQASIVEEYICCTALDPDAPRTARLHSMLEGAFPVGDLRIPDRIYLPWAGAEIEGICR